MSKKERNLKMVQEFEDSQKTSEPPPPVFEASSQTWDAFKSECKLIRAEVVEIEAARRKCEDGWYRKALESIEKAEKRLLAAPKKKKKSRVRVLSLLFILASVSAVAVDVYTLGGFYDF